MDSNQHAGDKKVRSKPSKWKKEKKRYKANKPLCSFVNLTKTNPINSKISQIKSKRDKNLEKKKYFKKPKKPEEPSVKTRSAIPSNPSEFSANWKQISNLIQNSDNMSSSTQISSNKICASLSYAAVVQSQVDKFKIKRQLKRQKAKSNKTNTLNTNHQEVKQPNDQQTELWFEVDDIYVEKMANIHGQPIVPTEKHLVHKNASNGLTYAMAIDCEMVGVGLSKKSYLARVSIVNLYGHCVYDKYVKPDQPVTDYRTFVSGIRPHHLANGTDLDIVRQEVAEIIKGRILVGHSISNDLEVLMLSHPRRDIRDTCHFFKYMFGGRLPSLKRLANNLLNFEIQTGEHCSVQDAQVTMKLYLSYRRDWEMRIKANRMPKH